MTTQYHQSACDYASPYVDGYTATSISGTINGIPIDGLSNYFGANNLLLPSDPQISAAAAVLPSP